MSNVSALYYSAMKNQKKALFLLRTTDSYPHGAAYRGILAAGDRIVERAGDADVVLTWNDYGPRGAAGRGVASRGGVHIVMENGYVARERGYYLLDRGGFNGRGETLYVGMDPERWERLGVTIEPWRRSGDYVLVVGQRGGGYNENAMANDWPGRILARIRQHTDMGIRYRPHPARQQIPDRLPHGSLIVSVERSLDEQIKGARVVVGWTSTALIRALVLGVPVVYQGPAFVLSAIAERHLTHLENPLIPEGREQALWDLAWRQWHVDEIASGEAWRRVAYG